MRQKWRNTLRHLWRLLIVRTSIVPLLVPPPGHKIGSAVFLAMAFLLISLLQILLVINHSTLGVAAFILNGITSPYTIAIVLTDMKHMHSQSALGMTLVLAHYPVIGFAWGFISPMHVTTITQATLFTLKRLSITFIVLTTFGLMFSLAIV